MSCSIASATDFERVNIASVGKESVEAMTAHDYIGPFPRLSSSRILCYSSRPAPTSVPARFTWPGRERPESAKPHAPGAGERLRLAGHRKGRRFHPDPAVAGEEFGLFVLHLRNSQRGGPFFSGLSPGTGSDRKGAFNGLHLSRNR